MRSFEELFTESSSLHGHHCAGQVLGVRMAMVGCREVGVDEPKGCKNLVVYVEMDRCATDAVQAVTGCSLGKRSLKFLDYGKMAATFVNTQTQQAVRVLAKDDARALAPLYVRDTTNPTEAQKQAYRIMPEEVLFSVKPVTLKIPAQEMPGYRGSRIQCPECGEGVNFHREIQRDGRTLCIPCAQGGFLPSDNDVEKTDGKPQIVLVIGYKKVGKTTLIERLIPELSNRGYRVGTVKHHHADFPVSVDTAGTDTWRHRQAGAASVALATPTDIAVFRDAESSISLDQIVSMLGALDIVLVEGFHEEPHAKIEVLTDHVNEPLCKSDQDLLALVAPRGTKSMVPTFSSSDITALADLIQDRILHRH